MKMEKQEAHIFATKWVAAWNSRNLEQILSHYEDDFEMFSPAIVKISGEVSGTLKGKAAVGDYWRRALARYPDLHFELRHVLLGVNSVTVIYQGVLGLSGEVFHFGATGKVAKAFAHYDL